MGAVTIITGRSGSGKSSEVYGRICTHMERGERALLIVSAQYSYEAEKALSSRFGGMIGSEVYSPERLCERILTQALCETPVLSKLGRRMILRRVAYLHKNELALYSRIAQSTGFAEHIDELITRFRNQNVGPDRLTELVEQLDEESLLRRKLNDIALLYSKSYEYTSKVSRAASDLYELTLPYIPESFVSECHIYIDGIDDFGERKYLLIESLAKSAKSLTIVLRGGTYSQSDDSLFLPDYRIYDRIRNMARNNGLPFYDKHMTAFSTDRTPALDYLERKLFSSNAAPYEDANNDVIVIDCNNRRAEVDQLADLVIERAREGVRYRDMAIVVSDLSAYGFLIARAFEKRGIPMFADMTRPLRGHSAAELVIAAARCCASGFAPQDVLDLVKCGYCGVDPMDVEVFENFILRYGLYGSSMTEPFKKKEVPEAAERVRSVVMPALMRLREGMNAERSDQKVRALYNYLAELELESQLRSQAQEQLERGNPSVAEEYAQVWNLLMELLSQLYAVMGDTKLGHKAFLTVLEEGANGCSMGVLPGTTDRVLVGDISRTRIPRVDTLFIVGCTEGMLPKTHSDDDIISDYELRLMSELGLPVWSDTQGITLCERLELYDTIGKARKRVYFTFSYSDGENSLLPSPLITSIRTLFPKLPLSAVHDLPSCKRTGFDRLVTALRIARRGDKASPLLSALLAYYKDDPEYGARLKAVLDENEGRLSPETLGEQTAALLYGNNPSMSASRLEQFNSCAFRHYLNYGLRAKERPELQETPGDIGTFLHDALDAFVREMQSRELSWEDADANTVDTILQDVMPSLLSQHNEGILISDPRKREALFLLVAQVKQACLSVIAQLVAGKYKPVKSEYDFGKGGAAPLVIELGDGKRVRLYGRIDRIDSTRDGLVRVVDYKTGGRAFDPGALWFGETLQLPIYLAAATANGGQAAGMYYMGLSSSAKVDETESATIKLNGVTASEADSIEAAESGLEGRSELISGLRRNRDGGIGGTVCTKGELELVVEAALKQAAETARNLMAGEAAIYPTEKACTYCPYHSVCRFDSQLKSCRRKRHPKLKLDELISLAGGESVEVDK